MFYHKYIVTYWYFCYRTHRQGCPTRPKLLGAHTMKRIILSALIAVLTLTCAHAQSIMSIELQIERIKAQIEAQVEIMRAARESAEIRVEQAQMRVEEKLNLAQEEIDRQIALVETYRDSLSNNGQSGTEAVDRITSEWKQTLSNAYADMRVQMQKVDEMLSQLKALRDRVSLMRQTVSVLFGSSNGTAAPASMSPLVTTTQVPVTTTPTTPVVQPTTTQPSTTPTTTVEQPTTIEPSTTPITTVEQPTTVEPSTTPTTTTTVEQPTTVEPSTTPTTTVDRKSVV